MQTQTPNSNRRDSVCGGTNAKTRTGWLLNPWVLGLLLVVSPSWAIGPGQPFQDSDFVEADTLGLAAGDVDGDGDIDAVEAKDDGLTHLYLNDGTGAFGDAIAVGNEARNSRDVALVDVDGDTDLDLIVANEGPNQLHINDGFGNFGAGSNITGDDHNTVSIALADVNGDTFPDLVAGNRFDTNRVYLNNLAGGFGAGVPVGTARNTQVVVLADINGDGNLDIVEGSDQGQDNRWYPGDGAGGFGAGVDIFDDVGTEQETRDIAVGDFDLDGDIDVVAAVNGNDDRIYLNDGLPNPTFTGQDLNSSGPTWSVVVADVGSIQFGNETSTLDGNPDIVIGRTGGGIQPYFGDGLGGFTQGTLIPNNNFTRDLVVADVDSDTFPDLLEANVQENVGNRIYRNNCTVSPDCHGIFDAASADAFTYDNRDTRDLVLVDLDGDNLLDMVEAKRSASNKVWLNTGSSSFFEGLPLNGALGTNAIAVGLVGNDGNLDIVAGNGGEANRLYRGNGDGTFNTGSEIFADADATRDITLADVDGDGDADVIAANSGGVNKLYENNGFGDFNSFSDFNAEVHDSHGVALGDLDGDGDLDVVFGNSSPNIVYFNIGGGNFDPGVDLFPGDSHNTRAVAIGDLDGDTDLDVVAGNASNQPNRAYFNDGTGTFTSATDIGTDLATTADIALADVDNDGDLDVVAGNNGRNRLYLNDGTGVFTGGVDLTGESNDTQTLALGDINNDGSVDLVVGNLNTFNRRLHINGNPTTSGIADVNVDEDAAPLDIDLLAAFEDLEDGDALLYSVPADPNGLVTTTDDLSDGTFTLVFNADQNGVTNLAVTATDSDGLSVTASFTVTIAAIADPPQVDVPIGAQIVTEGTAVNLDVSASFSDPDGDALMFSAIGLPPSLMIDANTGIITGVPTDADAKASPFNVDVTATSADGMVTDSFEMTVTDVADTPPANNPPELDAGGISDLTATEGDMVNEDVSVAFSDPDGDPLTFTAAGLPASLAISPAGVVSGTLTAADVGMHNVTITADDGRGGMTSGMFTLTVNDAGSPPPPPPPTPPPSGGGGSGGSNGPLALIALALLIALRVRESRGGSLRRLG